MSRNLTRVFAIRVGDWVEIRTSHRAPRKHASAVKVSKSLAIRQTVWIGGTFVYSFAYTNYDRKFPVLNRDGMVELKGVSGQRALDKQR